MLKDRYVYMSLWGKLYTYVCWLTLLHAQIAQVNHRCLIAKSIRHQLGIIDNYLDPKKEKLSEFKFSTVHLGALEKPSTLASVETANNNDTIFHRFRLRLAEYLNTIIPQEAWPDGKRILLQPHDEVCSKIPYGKGSP